MTNTLPRIAVPALLLLPVLLLGGGVQGAAAPVALETPAILADGCTGPMSSTKLNVVVTNVRHARGLIAVSLYADNPKKFLAKRGSLYVGRVPAEAGVTRMCIHLPAPGVYGLAVYHDENGDRSFKRNAIGLPAEGYGFSNNAPTIFGLPSFGKVRFRVPASGFETAVKLKYP
jgi:uncharacterized protein (DUF2141 family)